MFLKKTFFVFVLLISLLLPSQNGQAQLNLDLVGRLEYPGNVLSDVWGYTDDQGVEYAIVGLYNGTSIVSLANHTQPEELFFIPGDVTTWRDMKEYDKYGYVVNEGGGGLLIIDLSALPLSIDTYTWDGQNDSNYPIQLNTAHNIFIDEKGYAYIFGGDVGNGGAIILDLKGNPTNPPIAGIYDTRYVHDGYVRGDTLWAAEINTGTLSVVDVSNKAAPNVMGLTTTPGSTSHNCWLSDNGKYLYTTDEISDGYITAYDVSDISDIKEIDRIQSSPGQNVIPHNSFVLDNYIITSYYRDGITLHDATFPDNLVQIGHYDTDPFLSGNGFEGCWGVYPYFNSGYLIGTDVLNGLFVLNPNYIVPAYGLGTITDVATGQALPNVNIEVPNTGITVYTDFDGNFSFGVSETGFYDISYDLPGYMPATFTVYLEAGVQTDLSTSLLPDAAYTLNGLVIDAQTGNPLPDVPILFSTTDLIVEANADNAGNFAVPDFLSGLYDISVGEWGYKAGALVNEVITSSTGALTIEVEKGYYDDFNFDLGWTVSGTASVGVWERTVPNGTTAGGSFVNPGFDANNDIGERCFVTGNNAGSVGADDVDDGYTRLTSPIFDLSTYSEPFVNYQRWFVNAGGSGTPDDTLYVWIDNGVETASLETVLYNDPTAGGWTNKSFRVSDFVTPSENMTLIFQTADDASSGHLVEAGVDVFSVTEGDPFTGVNHHFLTESNTGIKVTTSPNPFNEQLHITLSDVDVSYFDGSENVQFKLYTLTGILARKQTITSPHSVLERNDLPTGMYIYVLENNANILANGKVLVGAILAP